MGPTCYSSCCNNESVDLQKKLTFDRQVISFPMRTSIQFFLQQQQQSSYASSYLCYPDYKQDDKYYLTLRESQPMKLMFKKDQFIVICGRLEWMKCKLPRGIEKRKDVARVTID